MRLARWLVPGDPTVREGLVADDRVVELPAGTGIQDLLEAGLDRALEVGAKALARRTGDEAALEAVTLLAPLRPATIRDFVTFEEHVEGMTAAVGGVPAEWFELPTFYFTNPHSVLATGDVVVPPAATRRLDFELEIAAVVGAVPGREGAHLDPPEAGAHVFGYTIMNDWSARDLQGREMKVRLGPAKGKDFGTSLGPWIVTADEFEPFLDADGFLAIRAEVRVNGELIGEDLVSNMGWPFPELVAYASRNSRVVPGDVLGSGTVGNGGCLGELWGRNGGLTPPPLQPGDVVAMTVEGIGELVGTVGDYVPAPVIPPARRRSRGRRR